MRRGLLPLLGLLAAGGQMTFTVPALGQFSVDIEPKSENTSGPQVVHYLHVAPKTTSDPPQGRVCLRLSINNSGTNALQLSMVTIAVGTHQNAIPISSTSFTEPVPPIPPGGTGIWSNQGPTPAAPGSTTFNRSDCLLFPLPAPNSGTLTLSFGGIAAPPITFALKAHDGPDYAFPGKASERPHGEFWQANSVVHQTGTEGSQLFAYDMGVVGFDPKTMTWSQCFPGVVCRPCSKDGCKPGENNNLQNTDYRIWGTNACLSP